MNKLLQGLTLIGALGGLTAASESVIANTSVSADAYTNGTVQGVLTDHQTDSNNVYYDGPGVSQAGASMTNGGRVWEVGGPDPEQDSQAAQADAWAFAAEGTLKARAAAGASSASTIYNAISGQGFARANWNDGLTVAGGAALFGQPGYITAEMDISGNFGGGIGPYGLEDDPFSNVGIRLSGTGMAAGDFSSMPSVLNPAGTCGGWNYCARQYTGYALDFSGYGTAVFSNIPSVISLTIPVIFGYQASLSYTLDLWGDARAVSNGGSNLGTDAEAYADYSSTLRWGGITGVFDAQGAPVAGFTLASDSGFDYLLAAPVPVPAAVWLFGSGLLGLIGVARRRKQAAA